MLSAAGGGVILAPCASFLERGSAWAEPSAGVLSPAQRELVATATELILPTTDTPGARDAGVPAFVEMMLADWFYDDERSRFLEGLAELDRIARKRGAESFVAAPPKMQNRILAKLEKEGAAEMARSGTNPVAALMEKTPPPAFFQALKQLTIVGYYTSEVGAKQEMIFEPIPGPYRGCIEHDPAARGWRRL